jgi:hypothetical protein
MAKTKFNGKPNKAKAPKKGGGKKTLTAAQRGSTSKRPGRITASM